MLKSPEPDGLAHRRRTADAARGIHAVLGSPGWASRSVRVSLLLLAAFVALAVVVGITGGPIGPDLAVHNWAVGHRSGWMTRLVRIVTFTGSGPFVYPAAGLVAVALASRARLTAALALCVTVAGGAALSGIMKVIVDRPRPVPSVQLGPSEATMSFPSGHTAVGALLIVGCALALATPSGSASRLRAGARWTRLPLVVAALWSAAIGWSRIYLGYHWLTDVIASWLLSVPILILLAPALRSRSRLERPRRPL
jgi:membrane-associated phospholipid phosphatase